MGHIKLQLEVKLKNNMILGGERALEEYHLFITYLDKDESFEADFKGNRFMIFGSKNGFRIRSVWDEPFGSITDDGLMIPQLDKVGFEFKKSFPSEHERYVFLKKVHDALLEWANVWEGFKYDSESRIKFENNIWTVSCERRYKDRRERKHFHTTKELMKKNIFF